MPAQTLKENIFHAPNTKLSKLNTWISHLHASEEAVKNCKERTDSHDPLHLTFPIFVLKYSAFPVLFKNKFVGFFWILDNLELRAVSKLIGD